jgi:signal transduction histidine kinase/ActR/RegA family two-component response regulator
MRVSKMMTQPTANPNAVLADLLASTAALASSRAETRAGQTNLQASEEALASSRAETKVGLADLQASEEALASSRAETKVGQTDLLASEEALASSRAQTTVGLADLLASTVALAFSRAEAKVGLADLLASEVALASSRAETKVGLADLLASEVALASSRAETTVGLADLLASAVALASSRAETKLGLADLLASAVALASSRAETNAGLADLLASAVALASSRAETKVGRTDLLASEAANKALSLANALLVASESVLENLVEKRTAALMREVEERRHAEDALRQGEKLQAIGQLTGGIAHDFNNVLQVVFSGTTLLRRELTQARRALLLDKMEAAAETAAALTGHLLAFARKQVLQPVALDLNRRLTGMTELLHPALGPRITLTTELAPDLWPVVADPNQLEVAILNLAVNARDAMLPEGGVFTLQTGNATLTATPERAAGEYVRLVVRDSGPGMPPDVMAHVFEPFFTTKALGKGTGLGLAQVYGFAKQSGGDVAIESAPGRGTAIFLHLPRPTAAALADAAAAARPDNVQQHAEQQAAGRTVLVVEDHADLASFTAAMLEGQGYATRCAANAADALVLLDAGEPVDAVFTDVMMPGPMDGVQLAAALRQRYPRVAVVIATGYSRSPTKDGPAVAEVLSKPYRLPELLAALGRAFAAVGHGSRREPGDTAPADG